MAAIKAMVVLALCFIVVCTTVAADSQHVCAYPQTCTKPGKPDPDHIVTSKARYNPDTKKCETIPEETGPHDCQKFESLGDCKKNCENAGQ